MNRRLLGGLVAMILGCVTGPYLLAQPSSKDSHPVCNVPRKMGGVKRSAWNVEYDKEHPVQINRTDIHAIRLHIPEVDNDTSANKTLLQDCKLFLYSGVNGSNYQHWTPVAGVTLKGTVDSARERDKGTGANKKYYWRKASLRLELAGEYEKDGTKMVVFLEGRHHPGAYNPKNPKGGGSDKYRDNMRLILLVRVQEQDDEVNPHLSNLARASSADAADAALKEIRKWFEDKRLKDHPCDELPPTDPAQDYEVDSLPDFPYMETNPNP